jgi:hypothetical protein
MCDGVAQTPHHEGELQEIEHKIPATIHIYMCSKINNAKKRAEK